MNVLGLFNGIGSGDLALHQCGIKVDNSFASEVDKWAIQIAQRHYPNTKQLGDVREIVTRYLPPIDLLMGGSSCQGFSFAGKGLNFADPRSALFFEFLRVFEAVKPTYFLLENVRMKKQFQDIITSYFGVQPILINSAMVSAQNRNRLYWTNIPGITQPSDRGIVLADILDVDDVAWEGRPCAMRDFDPKSLCHHAATATDIAGHDCLKRVYAGSGKSPTLVTGGSKSPKVLLDTTTPAYRQLTPMECERLQTLPDGYTEGVSNTQRYKAIGNGWTVDVISHILDFIER